MSGRIIALALSLVPIAGAAAAADKPAVRIDKHRASWETRVFDPLAPPEDLPPVEPGRDAVTVCDYWCKPILTFRTVSTSLEGESCVAQVALLETQVILELTMRSWLPKEASKGLRMHESAHRTICERVYDEGERLTRDAAIRLLASPVAGNGIDCRQAVEDAVAHQATAEICGLYTASRSEKARRVIAHYDEVVRGTRAEKLTVRTAIETAFKRFRDEPPSPP